jgi:nitrogen fixation protein NifQ
MSQRISLAPEIILHVRPHPFHGTTVYDALLAAGGERGDPFTTHVVACLFSLALQEMDERPMTLDVPLGLPRDRLLALVLAHVPHPYLLRVASAASIYCRLDEEEQQVLDLLLAHAADQGVQTQALCAMIARRSMQANHLWQDLGLRDRSELNRLLRDLVPTLHARNTQDMKWKKFFYRSLCELEGFTLCTAPSCRECCDFDRCFGSEDGESLLAQRRRATELLSQI